MTHGIYNNDKMIATQTIGTRLLRAFATVITVGTGFIFTCFLCIACDSLYFEKLTIAPLNNFVSSLTTNRKESLEMIVI
jgi:hypothetical protein